jgi:hypothetical protein
MTQQNQKPCQIMFKTAFQKHYMPMCITNLAFHDLVMESTQNSFIHNSYILYINNVHKKHV